MIEVRDLTKVYGARTAINKLNFSVSKGEVVGFLGPNGAGKTTTMKIITGFMAPSHGSVKVAGFDVFDHPIEAKRRIGYLPETPPVYTDMRVREYLKFVAQLKGVDSSKCDSLVSMAIEKTDLGSVANRMIGNLSKGYRQRVGISQALVSDPEILILDEPTVGLDPRQVAEIRNLIKSLAGQHTILLSTHILPEVQASCERIIIINQGNIVAEDTLEGIAKKMSGSGKVLVRVQKFSDVLLTSLKKISGVVDVQTNSNNLLEIETNGQDSVSQEIAGLIVSSGAGLIEIKAESMNLEDVFLKLTSKEEQQGVQL